VSRLSRPPMRAKLYRAKTRHPLTLADPRAWPRTMRCGLCNRDIEIDALQKMERHLEAHIASRHDGHREDVPFYDVALTPNLPPAAALGGDEP
jgi:hypothetical protein